MKSAIVYVLVALLVVPAASAGQAPQDSAAMWKTFADRLDVGAPIKVRTTDGKSVEAHLVQVTADAVRINPKTRRPVPVREIPFSAIQKIERQRDGWSPGAKVLLGVGVGAGAALLLFLAALSHLD